MSSQVDARVARQIIAIIILVVIAALADAHWYGGFRGSDGWWLINIIAAVFTLLILSSLSSPGEAVTAPKTLAVLKVLLTLVILYSFLPPFARLAPLMDKLLGPEPDRIGNSSQ